MLLEGPLPSGQPLLATAAGLVSQLQSDVGALSSATADSLMSVMDGLVRFRGAMEPAGRTITCASTYETAGSPLACLSVSQ